MAGGVQTLGNCLGKVGSTNGLVVTGATSGSGTGTKGTLANLPAKVDSSNRLVVIFV